MCNSRAVCPDLVNVCEQWNRHGNFSFPWATHTCAKHGNRASGTSLKRMLVSWDCNSACTKWSAATPQRSCMEVASFALLPIDDTSEQSHLRRWRCRNFSQVRLCPRTGPSEVFRDFQNQGDRKNSIKQRSWLMVVPMATILEQVWKLPLVWPRMEECLAHHVWQWPRRKHDIHTGITYYTLYMVTT